MSNEYTPFALVADDDALVRMDAAQILETAGFRVYEASGVDQALVILDQHSDTVQLLFTDVHMPPGKLTGFELAATCSQKWPHIGILIASGMAVPRDGELPKGAVFIRKPFSPDVVYEHLKNILPDGQKPEPLKTARFAK